MENFFLEKKKGKKENNTLCNSWSRHCKL